MQIYPIACGTARIGLSIIIYIVPTIILAFGYSYSFEQLLLLYLFLIAQRIKKISIVFPRREIGAGHIVIDNLFAINSRRPLIYTQSFNELP